MRTTLLKRFDKDATCYTVIAHRLTDEEDIKFYGGHFIITVLVGNSGRTYVLNKGFHHPHYIQEKYPNLTIQDAYNVIPVIDELIEHLSSRDVKGELEID